MLAPSCAPNRAGSRQGESERQRSKPPLEGKAKRDSPWHRVADTQCQTGLGAKQGGRLSTCKCKLALNRVAGPAWGWEAFPAMKLLG